MSNSIKHWVKVLATGGLVGMSFLASGQCPDPNPIAGANEVCPGSSADYAVVDNSPISSYLWELLDGGGVIVGPTNTASITIDWQDVNGGPFTLRLTEQVGQCLYQNDLEVYVADDIARYPFNCYSEINIPIDNQCQKLILPQHLLTNGVPDCPNTFEIELSIDGDIPVPNPVTIEYLGQIITAKVIHRESGRACESLVTLKDATGPTFVCENDTTICNDPEAWDPFDPKFKIPTAVDNCDGEVAVEQQGYEWIQLFADPDFSALIVRSWRAFDKNGNRNDCQDTIFMRRVIFDEITCPSDTTIACDNAGFDIDDPRTSGVPMYDGFTLYSNKTYCDFDVSYHDKIIYECPGRYAIHRDWTLTNLTGPTVQVLNCHQKINIIDTVGPSITWDLKEVTFVKHPDVFGVDPDRAYPTATFPTLDFHCVAHGYFPQPLVQDLCSPIDSLKVDILWAGGHISYFTDDTTEHRRFENLPRGKHLVTVQATDACHNGSVDTLIVIAEDIKAPYMVADQDPVIALGQFADVTWIDVSVFDEGTMDNCELITVLGRRVDWDTACGYTGDTTVSSAVRDHYDNFWDWLQNDNDTLCRDTIGYGWTNKIPFCCADACEYGTVTVQLMAIDASCNVSFLWVDVTVEDKTAPNVHFKLKDIDISCWAYNRYYRDSVSQGNFEVFGKYVPYGELSTTVIKDRHCYHQDYRDEEHHQLVYDTVTNGIVIENCDLTIYEEQSLHFEACGEGWIERKFVFKGSCNTSKGDSTKVIQRINIYNDCPLREYDIIWPSKDTTVYGCGLVEVATEGPRMREEDDCREIGIHHKDEVIGILFNADSTCLKIIRTWAVIDWCRQTEPFHEDWIGDQRYHYYEYQQTIYIKNQFGPAFADCDLDTLCIGSECSADLDVSITVSDDCTDPEDIKVSWTLYHLNDVGISIVDRGETAHAQVPSLAIGDYKLVWNAEDGCSNVTHCTDNFSVSDCVKPTPICVTSTTARLIPLDLDQDGLVDTAVGEIWAMELDVSSYDNCQAEVSDFRIRWAGSGMEGPDGNLVAPDSTERKLILGCSDIGTRMAEMWVVDQWGNADFCEVLIITMEPFDGCPDNNGTIAGDVVAMQGHGLRDVSLTLAQSRGFEREVRTDRDGTYSFGSIRMTAGLAYDLRPEKHDADLLDGVGTLDLIKISRHLLKREPLRSPMQLKAADVNNNGSVSIADIITLRKLILGKIETLPHERSWYFFNTEGEGQSTLSSNFDYQPLLHFTGVKVGDVTGDAGQAAVTSRAGGKAVLTYPNMALATEVIRVPMVMEQPREILGLQLDLMLDETKLELIALERGMIDITSEHWHYQEGRISLSWYGERAKWTQPGDTLFVAVLDVKQPGRLADAVDLRSDRIVSQLYSTHDAEWLSLRPIGVRDELVLSQNYPNPFRSTTRIDITLPQAEAVQWSIVGPAGKVYKQAAARLEAGVHTIEIQGEDLGAPGLYFYHLRAGNLSQSRRLLLLE